MTGIIFRDSEYLSVESEENSYLSMVVFNSTERLRCCCRKRLSFWFDFEAYLVIKGDFAPWEEIRLSSM